MIKYSADIRPPPSLLLPSPRPGKSKRRPREKRHDTLPDDEAPSSSSTMLTGMLEKLAPRAIEPEERLFSLGSVTSPASKEIEEKKDRDKDGSGSSKRQKTNSNSNSGDGGSSSHKKDKDSDNSQRKETDGQKKKEKDVRGQRKREKEQQGERTPAPRGRPRLNKGRDASGGGGGSSPSIKPSSPKEQRKNSLGGRPSMSPRPPGRPSKNSQAGGRNTPESRDVSSMASKRKHR